MNYEDFIRPTNEEFRRDDPVASENEVIIDKNAEDSASADVTVELDVQKAVVESLAADKAEQNVEISKLRKQNNELTSKVCDLTAKIDEMRDQLIKVGDLLAKNSEFPKSNQVTLLERNPEIEDRFDGETRDHVIEVIKEARDASEKDGRARRAQILESVLVANESSGNLEKKRQALIKLFNDNQNVINGQVINELDKLGINYKIGEKYLLVGEIIKRTY